MTRETQVLDDGTVQLGLLMETAHSHQDLVEGSLQRLQAHTQGLDGVVRDEIRRAFVAEFGELIDESARAAATLRSLGGAATLTLAWWGAAISVLPLSMVAALLAWWLPTPGEMAALRIEHTRLAEANARLTDSGGRIDLRRCGNDSRLCVRVDRHAPVYGEQSDYLVVRGY
jgi:hypothetical protein